MKITLQANCGNSLKMEFIKDLTIQFAAYDLDKAFESLSDDIRWNLIGEDALEGKSKFRAELEKMKHIGVSELTISSVLSHGKEGAVQGTMLMETGQKFGFADFYEFTGAKGNKVKAITSYVVPIGK